MITACIEFKNLKAEMARNSITIKEIAESIGVTRDTLSNKLKRKTPIALDEAFAINRIFFPEQDIHYLFNEAFQTESSESA